MQSEMDSSVTTLVVGYMHCLGCPECMALLIELPSLVKPRIAQRMSELAQISESLSCAGHKPQAYPTLMLFRDWQDAVQEEATRSADSLCSAGSTAD